MGEKRIYNIGVIGAGMIARVHMANLQKTGRARITWLAARSPDHLERIRSEFSVPNKTGNYKDILNDPAVDVIVITTPPDMHQEMFMESLKAGKHVLLEKPMALNLEEIDEMLDLKAKYPDPDGHGVFRPSFPADPQIQKGKGDHRFRGPWRDLRDSSQLR